MWDYLYKKQKKPSVATPPRVDILQHSVDIFSVYVHTDERHKIHRLTGAADTFRSRRCLVPTTRC